MEKSRPRDIAIVLICTLFSLLLFCSCEGEDVSEYHDTAFGSTIGTFRQESDTRYLIESDKGNRLYVKNYTDLLDMGFVDGQRIYAEFNFQTTSVTDPTESEINVSFSYPITVKEISMEGENYDDPISVSTIWASGRYLNIQYMVQTSASSYHKLYLTPADKPLQHQQGYKYLELHHDLNGNLQETLYVGIISFDISDYLADSSVKGFVIRVNTTGKGEEFLQCNIDRTSVGTRMSLPLSPNAELGGTALVR